MEGDEQIWSQYQRNCPSYSMATYPNSPASADATLSYDTNWHSQVSYRPHPTYTPMVSMYDQVPPNVNPFSSNDYGSGHLSDHSDAEVSYYSRMMRFEPGTHFYDDRGCSSTDTTMSSSSVSSVTSHSSLDVDAKSTNQSSKRKRQTNQKTKNSKAKKVHSSTWTYKRWPKPPYSYCGMIITVIQLSPNRELTLQEVHAGLMELFPFFRGSYLGWRDSVRHNLSHNQCFFKTVRNPPARASLWKVDWTQVTPAVFARQQSKICQSDTYKPTIHEHLGLPPFFFENISAEDTTSTKDVPKTPRQMKKESDTNRTPQMCDTHRFNVTLPCVEKCETQEHSPYQVYRQDCIPNHTTNTSFELIPKVEVSEIPVVNKVAPSSESLSTESFSHVFDLVTAERRSSIDAVQHLHTLCSPIIQSHCPPSETQPFSSDSDVYPRDSYAYPAFVTVKPLCDQEGKMKGDLLRSTDFSITSLIGPVSPCEAFVTSLIGSETVVDSSQGLPVSESVSDRSVPAGLEPVDDDDDLLIIDI